MAVYPHLWLWDSCFHAVIWAQLDDPRAGVGFEAVLAGQLDVVPQSWTGLVLAMTEQ